MRHFLLVLALLALFGYGALAREQLSVTTEQIDFAAAPRPTATPLATTEASALKSSRLKRITLRVAGLPVRALAGAPADTESRLLWASAGEAGQLYHSSDGGATWQAQPLTQIAQIVISPTYAEDQTLFTVGLADRNRGLLNTAVVYRSTDGGATWAEVTAMHVQDMITSAHLVLSPSYAADQTIFALSSGVGSDMGDTIVGSLHRSKDGGTTWQALSHPCVPTALAISPRHQADGVLYLGCGSAVGKNTSYLRGLAHSTSSGKSWRMLRQAFVISLSLLPAPAGQVLYAEFGDGAGKQCSADGGATWYACDTALGRIQALVASPTYAQDGVWLAVAGQGEAGQSAYTLIRSTDAGGHWEVVANLGASEGGPFTLSALPGAKPGRIQVLVVSGGILWRGEI